MTIVKKLWTEPQLRELISIVKTGICYSPACVVCPMNIGDKYGGECMVTASSVYIDDSELLHEAARRVLSEYLQELIEER
jgi:hypothetical protein